MSQETLCRLCISIGSKFKSLVDDTGQFNEVYEIAVRYFDPMIFNNMNGGKMIVICIKCWKHISDFYTFQQEVIQNQTQLKTFEEALRTEKLTYPMRQTPPISDEMTVSKNSVSILDVVHIPPAATSKAIPDTDYDVMIKDQSIVLQLPSNIEPSTSLDEVCERNQQETTELNDVSDKCFTKLNCDICQDTFSEYHLLLEHYRVNHENDDNNKEKYNNMEINQMESNSCVEISDDEADHDYLLYAGQMESNSCVEISDDDQNDNTTIELVDQLNDNDEYMLQQRSFDESNQTSKESNRSTSKALNAFQLRQIKCDKYIQKWKRDLECPICKFKFTKYSKYSLHFRSEHPFHRCFIYCCKRKFISRYKLVEHISLHINPNRFKCHICASNLSSKGSLKRHFQLLHTNIFTRDEIELMFREEVVDDRQDEILKEIMTDIQNRNTCNVSAEDNNLEQAQVLQSDAIQTVLPTTIDSTFRNVPSPTGPSIVNSALAASTEYIFPREEQHLQAARQLKQQETVQIAYNGKRNIVCTQCNATFSNNYNLRMHKKFHKNNQILSEGVHNNLESDPISVSNVEQLNVASYQSHPNAIDKNNFLLDQSSTTSIYPLDSEIELKNDEESIVTTISSENEVQVHEIDSEAQYNAENSNDDGDTDCYNEIRMPALDIVDIKEEIPSNFNNNESESNNSIRNDENDIQSLCNDENNVEKCAMVIDLVNDSSSLSSC